VPGATSQAHVPCWTDEIMADILTDRGADPCSAPTSGPIPLASTGSSSSYLAPVIARVACEDIKTSHMQEAVNAAPTAGEGDRLRRCARPGS
jgi:hypothetical protein